ncbi:MAG: PilT/PilU family type 4a pilus ATPase [bacterium]
MAGLTEAITNKKKNNKGKERIRRVRSRLPIKVRLHAQEDKESSPWISGKTINTSGSGVFFEVDKEIKLTSFLDIELTMSELDRILNMQGSVVRIEEIEEGKKYGVAVTIDKIEKEEYQFYRRHIERLDVKTLMRLAADMNAGDIHLSVNNPPLFRIANMLIPLEMEPFNSEDLARMIFGVLSKKQIELFKEELELDTAVSLSDTLRFRINVHKQRGIVEATLKRVEPCIRSVKELNLPDVIVDLARQQSGLILICGANSSGKTTTLAAMIDLINSERSCIIVTLEDPIEYVFGSKKSIVKQREVGLDSKSFANALKYALRQDADVITISEIKDKEVMEKALVAAEMGHLVIATFMAADTIQSLEKIDSFFPPDQHKHIRNRLAGNLRGIIYQKLLKRADKIDEYIPATESLISTSAVANFIKDGRLSKLTNLLETNTQFGMHTLDNSLEELYSKGIVDFETVMQHCKDKNRFIH